MHITDKKYPIGYNVLYDGPTENISGTNIEKYFDDFKHVRMVPFSVICQRIPTLKTTGETHFGRDLNDYFRHSGDPDLEKYSTSTELGNVDTHYRKFVKMHWLINDVLQNGVDDPITGVVYANLSDKDGKIEYGLHVHPGSFRKNAFRIMNKDIWVILFDAFELFPDFKKVSLREIFTYYKEIDNVDISMIHHDGNLMCPQILNNTKGSKHTRMMDNTRAWEEKIRHMFYDKQLKIFIGYDSTHDDASENCKNSILRYIPDNIDIQYLDVSKIDGWTREYKDQSTEFSYSRFLVPYLSNYEGVSIFCDDDFIFTENILNTLLFLSPEHSVACVKNNFEKKYDTKFTNVKDVWYDKKLWSSLMVFNNSHDDCKKLTLESVQTQTGKYLHQFEWTAEDKIGEIPQKWNWCEGYSSIHDIHDMCGLHFTRGGPWIKDMDCTDIQGLEIYDMYKYRNTKIWQRSILDITKYYKIEWPEDEKITQIFCEEINRDVR